MKTLKIEMIHDIVCSWCPLGYSHMINALQRLNITADFHFLPYELNPDLSETGEAIDRFFERRHQWDQSQLLNYQENLTAVASAAGVTIDFTKRTHYYNSAKAHQLMHWAESYNRQQELNELLIDTNFKHGLDIGNPLILLDLVEQLGLDSSKAKQVLYSGAVDKQLLLKKQRVQELALQSIPAFIVNEGTLISGSNSVNYFEQVLRSIE
ncbi:DsbA family oxidoreductase [Marinicella litoralis]|uniref:Putative DsbA family dithiol-disulfide isomerase n=1 Tax=Marinicella litoralis TaxID=644220 RepID=A0A4R6XW29_9GAMM|nr:DsbA family oxidoreductase [Marinicella litoralis]TDR20688.1 putative DsbA family dithiol-disulfide isomerase [Marinicella litoralis]